MRVDILFGSLATESRHFTSSWEASCFINKTLREDDVLEVQIDGKVHKKTLDKEEK